MSHVSPATLNDFAVAMRLEEQAEKVVDALYAKLHNAPQRGRFKNPVREQVRAAEDMLTACRKLTDLTFDRLSPEDQQAVDDTYEDTKN